MGQEIRERATQSSSGQACSYSGAVCTRYISPDDAAVERAWHIGRHNPWRGAEVYPQRPGIFVRPARDSTEHEAEAVVGQFGLIPWFAKAAKLTFSTCNARSEELAQKATFKDPWKRGQRCIVPAVAFYEPCWETGKNVWWSFRRADGELWGLAGLWNTWTDKATGELVESFTMLTINADAHPLMNRMHRPDPKRPPNMQDKRSVIPIERADVERWLYGTQDDARDLMRLAPAEAFDAAPH